MNLQTETTTSVSAPAVIESVAISNPPSPLKVSSNGPSIIDVIDVDLLKFDPQENLKPVNTSASSCKGHVLDFPDGKSPHTCYPFALHNTLVLPWDIATTQCTMAR
jgi:hypothetical protein